MAVAYAASFLGPASACTTIDPPPEWQGAPPAIFQIKSNSSRKSFPVKLAAQKKWTVFIVPHEHLDIGFTDYPDKIAELHSQAVDGVLDLLPTHPEFRWTLDGSWVAEQYLKGRSPEKQEQFLQSIRDSKITLPMQYANQHTGVASLEGLIRSLYPSAALAKKYFLPLGAAHITDVPSYSWSYASILHDAGVKYFAAATCRAVGGLAGLGGRIQGCKGEELFVCMAIRCTTGAISSGL